MQNAGIVAEFNPFHSGHKYLIDTVKKNGNAVICVMSGNYVQRGDTAITDKFTRAKMAVMNGADLVLELPTPWAMSTAQNFALGAVGILSSLGITDKIVFGSECGDIAALKQTANILKSDDFNNKVNKKISSVPATFAAARNEVFESEYPSLAHIISAPNDTLGTEYILSGERVGFKGEFECVRRIGAAHDSVDTDITVSASLIREKIKNGKFESVAKFMPDSAAEILKKAPISDICRIENAILCKLRMDFGGDMLPALPDISEGIENRLKNAVLNATNLEELFELTKTKRYTLSRIRRLCLSAFLGIDNSFFGRIPPYIRVLAMGDGGEALLKQASKKSTLPIITKTSGLNLNDEFTRKVWLLETAASDVYALSLNPPQKCGKEYYQKIIKT